MDLKLIGEKVVEGDAAAVESLVRRALAEELPPLEIITQCLLPAMGEVGERFVEAARENSTKIVALSVLMTTTMPAMKRTIDALVGGALR
jgi:methanogenic corrinoid protein MtbC1